MTYSYGAQFERIVRRWDDSVVLGHSGASAIEEFNASVRLFEANNRIEFPAEYVAFLEATIGINSTCVDEMFAFLKVGDLKLTIRADDSSLRFLQFADWMFDSYVYSIGFDGEIAVGIYKSAGVNHRIFPSFREFLLSYSTDRGPEVIANELWHE